MQYATEGLEGRGVGMILWTAEKANPGRYAENRLSKVLVESCGPDERERERDGGGVVTGLTYTSDAERTTSTC